MVHSCRSMRRAAQTARCILVCARLVLAKCTSLCHLLPGSEWGGQKSAAQARTCNNAVALPLTLQRVGAGARGGVAAEGDHGDCLVLWGDGGVQRAQVRRETRPAADGVRQGDQAAATQLQPG